MREDAKMKIWSMIEVSKRELHNDPFWKIDSPLALIESQLREIELLEYIYKILENE